MIGLFYLILQLHSSFTLQLVHVNISEIGAPTCQSWQFTRSPFRQFKKKTTFLSNRVLPSKAEVNSKRFHLAAKAKVRPERQTTNIKMQKLLSTSLTSDRNSFYLNKSFATVRARKYCNKYDDILVG